MEPSSSERSRSAARVPPRRCKYLPRVSLRQGFADPLYLTIFPAFKSAKGTTVHRWYVNSKVRIPLLLDLKTLLLAAINLNAIVFESRLVFVCRFSTVPLKLLHVLIFAIDRNWEVSMPFLVAEFQWRGESIKQWKVVAARSLRILFNFWRRSFFTRVERSTRASLVPYPVAFNVKIRSVTLRTLDPSPNRTQHV